MIFLSWLLSSHTNLPPATTTIKPTKPKTTPHLLPATTSPVCPEKCYDDIESILKYCQNEKDPLSCVFYEIGQKVKHCLPCACQIICELDSKLCQYCHCSMKCFDIIGEFIQVCRAKFSNPKEEIKCIFDFVHNKAPSCINCVCPVVCYDDSELCKYCSPWKE